MKLDLQNNQHVYCNVLIQKLTFKLYRISKFHLVGFWKYLHSSSSIDCLRWKRLDFQKHLAPILSNNFSVLWYWHVIMRTDQPYWFAVFVSYGWNDEIFITTCLYRPLREQEDTMSNDNVRGLWFHIEKIVRK